MHNRGVESDKKFITSPTERREMTLTRSARRKTEAEDIVEAYGSESDIPKRERQKARACPDEKSRRLGSHSSEMKNSQPSGWQCSACELTGSSRAMEKKSWNGELKKKKQLLIRSKRRYMPCFMTSENASIFFSVTLTRAFPLSFPHCS